ncbi:MAG: STM4011 family radical SAM protein [Rhodocyclaceae bacterium]
MLNFVPDAMASDTGVTAPVLTLLYRGTLSSCNYDCHYCPFAKRQDTRATMQRDAAEVRRFVDWLAAQQRSMRVLFTPWGEALVRQHYRQAMSELAAMTHVTQVALQTNLSGPLSWLEKVPPGKLSLWCTYHPDQTTLERFVARCDTLGRYGIAFSVGVVAMREHFEAIRALRAALPPKCYLWLNAYDRRGSRYYTAEDIAWLDAIDPWFRYNRQPVASLGKPCRGGSEVLSVDGQGNLQRCHFLPQKLGNLYESDLDSVLKPQICTRKLCDCFIGYAHRQDLPFYQDFGPGVLARIPHTPA